MKKKILLIGAGSIGSWTALCLSRTDAFDIYVQDFDTFERKNLGGQFVSKHEIGMRKANAIKSLCNQFNETDRIFPIYQKFDASNLVSPYTIAGTDNIESRRIACEKWLDLPQKEIFIDARLSGTDIRIYVLTKNTPKEIIEQHVATMYPPDETIDDNAICSIRQTSYCGAIMGGYITSKIMQYISGLEPDYATELNMIM